MSPQIAPLALRFCFMQRIGNQPAAPKMCRMALHTQISPDLLMALFAGVKPGRMPSAGAGRGRGMKGGKPGERAGAAAWQGMRTKGLNKLVKGSAAAPRDAPAGRGGIGQAGGAPDGQAKGKRAGKRPAVAARKAKAPQKGKK